MAFFDDPKTMKKSLVLLSLIAGIVLFGLVLSSVGTEKIISSFEIFSFYKYLFVFGFYFLIYLLSLARWGMIINALKFHIPFAKLLPIRLTEYAVSYITPVSRLGGEPAMAYLLKNECNINYKKGILIIILNKFLDFAAGILLSVPGIILFIVFYGKNLSGKIDFFLALIVLMLLLAVVLFYFKIMRKEGFFSVIIRPFKDVFKIKNIHESITAVETELHHFFKKEKRKMIIAFCICLIVNLLLFVNYKILALFLGVNLSLIQLFIIFLFTIIASMLPIPGSLGSFEGCFALVFLIMGFNPGLGVAFALIIRSFELILTSLGLLFFSYYGIKSKNAEKGLKR